MDHDEARGSLGAYALGALPPEDAASLARHLEQCDDCRAELEELRPAVELLAAAAPRTEPPPALKHRIMAVVEAEAELLRAAGPAADRPVRATRPRPRFIPRLGPVLAGAAACFALALGVVGGVTLIGDDDGASTRTIVAQVGTPGGSGRLEVDDGHAELRVAGLPVPRDGRVYQVWMKREGGAAPEPTDAFFSVSSAAGNGRVAVPTPSDDVEAMLVTEEPAGGSTVPSRAPVLSVAL